MTQPLLCEEGNLHLLPLFRRFSGFFLSTRTTERVEHGVIRLVAAVLEQLIAGFLHNRKSNLPGSGIDLRIVNRHFVLDCVGVHACETFHQPKGVARGNTIAVPPDTGLVVEEIRCLDNKTGIGRNGNGIPTSDALRLVERFTRVDSNTIQYEMTVDDPKIYTRSWKIAFPITQEPGYQLFEYSCHETNYAMFNSLSGARAQEAAEAAK